jgi:hypothetical protein
MKPLRSARGSILWTTWTTPHVGAPRQKGVQFFVSQGVQFRMSFDNNAWMGRESDAKDALAKLDKVYPGFTLQAWEREQLLHESPSEQRWAMITEGLRKAGLPEK